MGKRFSLFAGATLFAAAMVFDPLRELMDSAKRSDYYSHIILIPLVTGYLIYSQKKDLLGNPTPSYGAGGLLTLLGMALYALGFYRLKELNLNDQVALLVLAAILFWVGGFLLLYGLEAFRRNSFPFLFLLFMIPLPHALMSQIIYALQVASTEVSEVLYFLSGVPYQREGFVFHLPGISVEVAEVCSGIRSSLALFITSILAGHFFLDRLWKKAILAAAVFPVTVFKNGARILTLSLLGVYVDPKFLTGGFLHQSGGFLFFIPALGLLGLTLWALRRKG
ncbi:MAG: exosortase [Syntrophaceae bacterium]|nr:exosortase [Syntrophaceae bacterium]